VLCVTPGKKFDVPLKSPEMSQFWNRLYANCYRKKIGYRPIPINFTWRKFQAGLGEEVSLSNTLRKVDVGRGLINLFTQFVNNKEMFLNSQFELFDLDVENNKEHFEHWCMLKACAEAQIVFRVGDDTKTLTDKWTDWETRVKLEHDKALKEKTWSKEEAV
jgi:hypothetical protein